MLHPNGVGIAVHEWGDVDAPPLLLVHGGTDFARTFDVFAPKLAAGGWRVVSWDHRGHGDSAYAELYSWDADMRDALAVFDRPGAKPDAARTIRALRAAGVKQIPRGPRPATRANVAQLTTRELDVLHRLSQGQSNREIAKALFLSPRTVGHHVSAILGKLGVSSRAEARAQAEELDLFQGRSSSVAI